jgi:hypothetical protein
MSLFRNDRRKEITQSWLLGILLQRLDDAFGKPFPIPVRTRGAETVFEAWDHPKGVVICCVHLPLWNVLLRSLVEMKRPPSAILAGPTVIRDGMISPWGSGVRLPALAIDKNIYVKARGILRRGESIATMIDNASLGRINVNLLRLIGVLGARVIFTTIELQASGEILVRFYNPPDPFCKTDESIRANVDFYENRIDGVLHGRECPVETEEGISYGHTEQE